jgi:hypothetical protein
MHKPWPGTLRGSRWRVYDIQPATAGQAEGALP